MSIVKVTSLAWLLVIAAYGLRTFLAFAPGGELLWKDLFRGETGILDRGEAILWIPVIIVNLLAFFRSQRQKGLSLGSLWYLGIALVCVVLLGEEISWGQHIIGFESSARMLEINAQQESNLHNLNLSLMLGLAPSHPMYPWLTNFNHVLNPAYYLFSCILWIAIPAAQRGLGWRLFEWIPALSSKVAWFLAANVVAYLVVDKLFFDVGEIFEFGLTCTYLLAALSTFPPVSPKRPILDPLVVTRLMTLRAPRAVVVPALAAMRTRRPSAHRVITGGRGTLLR